MAMPVAGVTAGNFTIKAMAFIQASEGELGFVIALKPYPGHDNEKPFVPTVRPWGAWMAYWSRISYRHKAIEARGYATTPTEWPSDFDAQAAFMADQAAADAFEWRWRDERERAKFHAGSIARRTGKAMDLWRQTREPVPQSHLEPEAVPPIDISDFPAATATRAEQREWEARQRHAQEGSHGRDGEGPGASDLATAQTQESAPLAGA